MSRPATGRRRFLMLGLLAATAAAPPSSAQELIGAEGAIRKVREAGASPAAAAEDAARIIRELADAPAADPAAAAAAWLAGYDRWLALPSEARQVDPSLSARRLLDALPGPPSWDALADLIEARPVPEEGEAAASALALRMLGHRLAGRAEALKQDVERALKIADAPPKRPRNGGLIEAIAGAFRNDPVEDEYWKHGARQLAKAISEQQADPRAVAGRFEEELDALGETPGQFLLVPDLVGLIGKEAATPLLLRALRSEADRLDFAGEWEDDETVRTARELALAHIKELPRPRWRLCHSLDAVALYDAFAAMPADPETDAEKAEATTWHIAALIAANRPIDVLKAYEAEAGEGPTIGYIPTRRIEEGGKSGPTRDCLAEVLKARPDLPFWDLFATVSRRVGDEAGAIVAVDRALGRDDLKPGLRQTLRGIRIDLLLATDRLDDAAAETSRLLAEPAEPDDQPGLAPRFRAALRLADVGRLTGREEWVRIGSEAAEKILTDSPSSGDAGHLADLLLALGRPAQAEAILVNSLAGEAARQVTDGEAGRVETVRFLDSGSLSMLLAVYDRAGRHADVLALLEDAPWWGFSDLRELLAFTPAKAERGTGRFPSAPLLAARALESVGRRDEARRIAAAMARAWPEVDAAWQVALETMGDDFVALAERAAADDPFEERPTIWLATYRLDRGELDEAERLARAAIAIDPSDGEQGPGDRLRAYAVLARVLAKKGDAAAAAGYEKAVAAIRLAERADEHGRIGLTARAVRMYRESLAMFADAYCIQSRLAVQLAEAGDLDGAAEHYQRAFELMPDSFGRVESHCFGCEGVFSGPTAESVADRVFLKLVAERPADPRVRYLLGYLRRSQSRDAEALKSFREAVRLDPDYLSAWRAILACDRAAVPDDVRDDAAFAVLRLDPTGRHAGSGDSPTEVCTQVKDLRRLWEAADAERRRPRPDAAPLFELKAARRALRADGEGGPEPDAPMEDRIGLSCQAGLAAIADFLDGTR